jgi:predicted transcriptional regulator
MEDWMLDQREAVAARIEQGFAQAERGELMDGDEAVEMLRRRRTERLKPHG